MYLRQYRYAKNNRIFLAIVQSYRDKDGKSRQKTVKKIGYLDQLEDQHEDPIAHFKEIAGQMTTEHKKAHTPLQLEIQPSSKLIPGADNRKNFGYTALSHLYHELEIDYFINNRRRYTDARYNHNAIFKMLVYSRLLWPASKKRSFEKRHAFFDKMDFSLDDVYRSLSFFTKHKEAMLLALHHRIKKVYGRNTSLVYYDVTNYFFESETQDELRRKGYSKENRRSPIVQMGLFMDTEGLPLSYELFPGSTLDKQTLIPMISKVRKQYDLGRFIVVGDRGMMSGDNIRQILLSHGGYVLSYSIKSAESSFKNYVLDQSGYQEIGESGFKIKSRIYPREIHVSNLKGKKKKISIDEKQIIFYSPKYAERARKDRQGALAKAQKLVDSPAAYTRATSYGAAKYVNELTHTDSGEVIDDAGRLLFIDEEAIEQDARFDGYYAILTSELDRDAQKIVDIYRGLWKIEDSFRITKSDLETRPVYLSREDHIQAHFLTCFVSLVLVRILEKMLGGKYPVPQILKSLKNSACSLLEQNLYLFDYVDPLLVDLGKLINIDFTGKYRRVSEIRKILGNTKKMS